MDKSRYAELQLAVACVSVFVLCGEMRADDGPRLQNQVAMLSQEDKRSVVVSAYQQRGLATRNVEASATTHIYNVNYANGKRGGVKEEIARYVYKLRKRDGVEWLTVDWWRPQEQRHPTSTVVTVYDSTAGVAKSMTRRADLKIVYGAIDNVQEPAIINCHFVNWLHPEAKPAPERFLPFWYIERHQAEMQFRPSQKENEVELAIKEPQEFRATTTFSLDPNRGFLPVHVRRRLESSDLKPGETARWTQYDFDVKEAKQVGNEWFPTQIAEMVTSDKTNGRGWVTVTDTMVDSIELGSVKKEDLAFDFPKGANVHDRFQGIRFIAGAEPRAPTAQVGRGGSTAFIAGFVLLNAGAVLFLVFEIRRRRRKKAAETTG